MLPRKNYYWHVNGTKTSTPLNQVQPINDQQKYKKQSIPDPRIKSILDEFLKG
ncbi:hypothetical protein [Bacillus sp. KH172YL63]|uniref:hypothetical protein n=1 Tax=Bacillus sp. KH172YL63 TaxID=2709784 RepID=UPI0013E5250D|nr:hypothetical protein [Bacillus sp. KH172YL63]BCB03444.1 hypothetical protein KH172YL63_15770 [Bacillus sp. KH172YL63]